MLWALAMATVSGPLTLPLSERILVKCIASVFRIDGGNHLFARLNFDQLRARLANLVVKRISMALLDDDFVPRKTAYVGNILHAGLKVFGHHAGIAYDHGRGCATRHQTGVADGRFAQFLNELTGCDLKFVDRNTVLVASPDELHDLRLHH